MDGYLTATDFAELVGISKQWACKLASEGRIEGAKLEGRTWMIPEDAPKPERYKRGRMADPEGSRARRLQEAAERRARRMAEKAAPTVSVDPSKLEGRERWLYYVGRDPTVRIFGKYVFEVDENLEPDEPRDAAWVYGEPEEVFRNREIAFKDWAERCVALGKEDEATKPADLKEWYRIWEEKGAAGFK